MIITQYNDGTWPLGWKQPVSLWKENYGMELLIQSLMIYVNRDSIGVIVVKNGEYICRDSMWLAVHKSDKKKINDMSWVVLTKN